MCHAVYEGIHRCIGHESTLLKKGENSEKNEMGDSLQRRNTKELPFLLSWKKRKASWE
jgi:hypothetical protein